MYFMRHSSHVAGRVFGNVHFSYFIYYLRCWKASGRRKRQTTDATCSKENLPFVTGTDIFWRAYTKDAFLIAGGLHRVSTIHWAIHRTIEIDRASLSNGCDGVTLPRASQVYSWTYWRIDSDVDTDIERKLSWRERVNCSFHCGQDAVELYIII